MSANMQDGALFKPRVKQTGVWSDDYTKIQSASTEQNYTEFMDDAEVLDEDDSYNDDETDSSLTNTRFNSNNPVQVENVQSSLSKLSVLNDWADVNLGLLLGKFSSDNNVKEEDIAWNWDSLFTEMINELSDRK